MKFQKKMQIHRDEFLMSCWWVLVDFLLFYYDWGYISDECLMSFLWHFDKSILGLELVEISEFLRKPVEIIRNCWICWVPVISEFSAVSDGFLMSFLWALMSCWWVSDEFLWTSYCFIMIGVIFLMSFWWIFGGLWWVFEGF